MENEEDTITTIKVTRRTRRWIKAYGRKGEKYEDVILRLLGSYAEQRRKNEGHEVLIESMEMIRENIMLEKLREKQT